MLPMLFAPREIVEGSTILSAAQMRTARHAWILECYAKGEKLGDMAEALGVSRDKASTLLHTERRSDMPQVSVQIARIQWGSLPTATRKMTQDERKSLEIYAATNGKHSYADALVYFWIKEALGADWSKTGDPLPTASLGEFPSKAQLKVNFSHMPFGIIGSAMKALELDERDSLDAYVMGHGHSNYADALVDFWIKEAL